MATPAGQIHRRSLCRILLVDDHDDAISATTMLLQYEGHDVAVADRGQRALELTETFKPALL